MGRQAGGVKKMAGAVKRKLLVITKTIRSWSYSRIRDYEQCPYMAGLKHALGIKEPGNAAMQRGSDIGKMAEQYVKGELAKLPMELGNFADGFKRLRTLYKKNPKLMVVEDNWAFRKDWTETFTKDWDHAVCRIKMDVATVEKDKAGFIVTAIDHKTGKYDPKWGLQDYLDQLDLYFLGCLLKFGHLKNLRVRGELWFLDHGITYPPKHATESYVTMADMPRLKQAWQARADKMMGDRRFHPTPSRKCEWCFYRSSNATEGGGQCIH